MFTIDCVDTPVCLVLYSKHIGMTYFCVVTEFSDKYIRGVFFIRSYNGDWNYGQGRGLFWWNEIAELEVVDKLPAC
jgi:hypothetical protein